MTSDLLPGQKEESKIFCLLLSLTSALAASWGLKSLDLKMENGTC